MFEDLKQAIELAKKDFPNCTFSVRQQADGPTIISVKGKDKKLRSVIYVRQSRKTDDESNR
mgnify:CR=1 FL=1